MTNPLQLIRDLDTSPAKLRSTQRLKPRRQRRCEMRDSEALLRSADRIRAAKARKSA